MLQKKHIDMQVLTISLFFIGLAFLGFTQQQVENGDFENWENQGTAEEEPVDWSSLKTADAWAGSAPSVLSPDTGRNGGTCARLEVKEVFGIEANGIMTNGRVHADFDPENGYVFTDESDPKWHTSFSDRPDSLIGWYKYAPENNDKGKIDAVLHVGECTLPFSNGNESNMIGRAKFEFTTAQTSWTRFSKAFTYVDQQAPEYILTTIASGDSTISQAGSTLWIDDISLVYNSTNSIKEASNEITTINASNGYLHFSSKDHLTDQRYAIRSLTGQLIQSGVCEKNVLFDHPSGIYLITVKNGDQQFTKKVYVQ